jgi:hypothetical protein
VSVLDAIGHTPLVEPAESAVLAGGPGGSHGIDGIGIEFVPPLWEPHEVNELMTVSTADAKAMARRLAAEAFRRLGPDVRRRFRKLPGATAWASEPRAPYRATRVPPARPARRSPR